MSYENGYRQIHKVKVTETTHRVVVPFGFSAKYIKAWFANVPDDAVMTDWTMNDDANRLEIDFIERKDGDA